MLTVLFFSVKCTCDDGDSESVWVDGDTPLDQMQYAKHMLGIRCVRLTFVGWAIFVTMDVSYTLGIRSSFVGNSSYTSGVR